MQILNKKKIVFNKGVFNVSFINFIAINIFIESIDEYNIPNKL
jgi:hypothetical protein